MIPLHKVLIAPDALEKVGKTLYSGVITEGERVKEFEAKLREYLGSDHILAMNSCTSAISLALHLCGVGPGDEVISTPMTCAATNTHVVLCGAKLVWADVDTSTGNISQGSVTSLITPRTKAIIVVDWAGRPAELTDNHCIPVIQDSAHSFGSHSSREPFQYRAWSFQAIKHLTTGDGGALKVPKAQFERARRLRWFGIDREVKAKFRFMQDIPEVGYKYHMNDLAASLGLANFDAAVKAVSRHGANAQILRTHLKDCKRIGLPPLCTGCSWWFFPLLMPNWEKFVEFAEARGVQAGPVHGRNDNYSAFGKAPHPLPGVDYYASHHVAVPCGWWLSQEDVNTIADTVIAWDKRL